MGQSFAVRHLGFAPSSCSPGAYADRSLCDHPITHGPPASQPNVYGEQSSSHCSTENRLKMVREEAGNLIIRLTCGQVRGIGGPGLVAMKEGGECLWVLVCSQDLTHHTSCGVRNRGSGQLLPKHKSLELRHLPYCLLPWGTWGSGHPPRHHLSSFYWSGPELPLPAPAAWIEPGTGKIFAEYISERMNG